jgi:hypothetical protein
MQRTAEEDYIMRPKSIKASGTILAARTILADCTGCNN